VHELPGELARPPSAPSSSQLVRSLCHQPPLRLPTRETFRP
jgi:hypothetical protein